MGDKVKRKIYNYHSSGILSGNLEDLENMKRIIAPRKVVPNTLGEYLSHIRNLLGKIRDQWDKATPELKTALKSKEDVHRLWGRYNDVCKELKSSYHTNRAKGESGTREKFESWEVIMGKGTEHVEAMMNMMDKDVLTETEKTQIRNAVIYATQIFMCNTRSAFATVKRRNYDPEKDNYISFSQVPYGDTIVVWNETKVGNNRFNQIVPEKLVNVLKKYVRIVNPDDDYLFHFNLKDQSNLIRRKDNFHEVVGEVNAMILGKSLGLSDMRRIQITHEGRPDAMADLEKLALQYHHSVNQHLLYFRTAAS